MSMVQQAAAIETLERQLEAERELRIAAEAETIIANRRVERLEAERRELDALTQERDAEKKLASEAVGARQAVESRLAQIEAALRDAEKRCAGMDGGHKALLEAHAMETRMLRDANAAFERRHKELMAANARLETLISALKVDPPKPVEYEAVVSGRDVNGKLSKISLKPKK